MDAYGHVNNAVYLTYLEQARHAWVADVLDGGKARKLSDEERAALEKDFAADH